jgi:putative oxidoreductase
MKTYMTPVRTAAYSMLAAVFVKSGADAVMTPERLVPRAKRVTDRVTPTLGRVDGKIPTETKTLVQINGGVQAASGLLLLTPLRRPAAAVLAASLVPTTAAGHAFWTQDTPADRSTQLTHFLKNVSIFGGLVLAALDTGGKPSLRWRATHLAHDASRRAHYANESARRSARHQRDKVDIAVKAAAAGRRFG